jgi:ribose transport system substrate-binding protein
VNKKIRSAGIAMVILVMFLIAACGESQTSSSNNGPGTSTKVAAVIKGLDNPYFQAMQQGIEAQAKTQGVALTLQAAQSTSDTTGQADKLQALAQQNYNCYIVNPISQTNLIQPLLPISQAKKTIINIDSPIDPSAAQTANVQISSYIGTDNISAGKTGAQEMTTLLPNGGTVALVGGIAGDTTSQQRLNGFQQGLPTNIHVVQTVAANWDRPTALTDATNILRAHPDLSAFFVANDDMALGVSRAISDASKQGQIKVVSVDGIQDALKAIQAGQLSATVSQYPYTVGAMGIEACKAAAAGKKLPSNVPAPIQVITSSNASQALSSFPRPFASFTDPLASLLGK